METAIENGTETCELSFGEGTLMFQADRRQISTAVKHLLDNARDADPEGEISITVQRSEITADGSTGDAGPAVEIRVCDQGHGVDEGLTEQILGPMWGAGMLLLVLLALPALQQRGDMPVTMPNRPRETDLPTVLTPMGLLGVGVSAVAGGSTTHWSPRLRQLRPAPHPVAYGAPTLEAPAAHGMSRRAACPERPDWWPPHRVVTVRVTAERTAPSPVSPAPRSRRPPPRAPRR